MRIIYLAMFVVCMAGCGPYVNPVCVLNEDCIREGFQCGADGMCVKADEISFITESLEDAVIGEEYSQTVEVQGGVGPFSWRLSWISDLNSTLEWIDVDGFDGVLENTSGVIPDIEGNEMEIVIFVSDSSNGGLGLEKSKTYSFNVVSN